MTDLIEAIQHALHEDATPDAKQRGAAACRTILTALDAEPGASLVPAASAPPANPLAGMEPTQVLDLVIDRLRAMVAEKSGGTDAQPTATPGYQIEYVPIPKGGAS